MSRGAYLDDCNLGLPVVRLPCGRTSSFSYCFLLRTWGESPVCATPQA
jgi:hypothetical protein